MDERGSLLEPHHLADRADPSPRSAPLRRGLAACATAAALVAAVVLVLHARVLRRDGRGCGASAGVLGACLDFAWWVETLQFSWEVMARPHTEVF